MARKTVTSDAKPRGRSAFTSLELSQRLLGVETQLGKCDELFKATAEIVGRHERQIRRLRDLLPDVSPAGSWGSEVPGPKPATQTLTAEEQAGAAADAELRKRMAVRVREFWLEEFRDELADKDMAFVSLLWLEMAAVAIASSVTFEPEESPTSASFTTEAQITEFLQLAHHELERRVRFYVDKRRANPISLH